MAYKYNPFELYCSFAKTSSKNSKLTAEGRVIPVPTNPAAYEAATEEEMGDMRPLDMFEGYSRIWLAIDERVPGGEGKRAYCKIGPEEAWMLHELLTGKLHCPTLTPPSTTLPLPYTVQIPAGAYKGKTPAEVLKEEGESAVEKLQKNAEYYLGKLKEHTSAALQDLLEALYGAIALYKIGRLGTLTTPTSETPQFSGREVLLEAKYRSTKEKNDQGQNRFYDYSITYDGSRRYPVTVRIVNYWATLVRRSDGTQSPGNDKNGEIDVRYNLTLAEAWKMSLKIKNYLESLTNALGPKLFVCATQLEANKKADG